MSENNSSFKIMLQAMLDKAKSIINIKSDIKNIEPKLPKVKVKATLDSAKTKSELNAKLKSIRPKVKVDADTTQAVKKIKKLGRQKIKPTVQPTVDNSQVVSGLKEAQKQTKTLWDRFISGAVGVNLVRMSVQKVTQAIYQAIAGIKELDKIKTDIQTASGVDDSKVNSMMKSYNQIAKDLSSTTKDVGNAANEIVRMGESLSDTNKLIENSTMLAKIGMIESSQATEYLISSMKGFQITAQDSTQIIDKLTSVDMKAAVSAGGLAEAMSRCANIANNSGTSMDRLIGYMATVGEVTQDSMSVIGNSFKSMYSRMNNIKIGKFIDDETGESLSDTEAVLNKLGIQLRDTQNTYRDFDDVLDDVGNNWKSFTQVEQNAISVAIAGTMQRERFIALMNNYSNALKYSEVAANSAGSALERYGVYQDSIEAKTNELTAAIESLSMNTVSEELYSGIIQATTGLVEFLDKTNLLKGALSGLVAMGVSKAFISISTGIISAVKSTTQLSAVMALFDKGRSEQNLLAIGAACKGLNDNQLKLILSTKGLRDSQRLVILEGMGVVEAERQQTLATLGFASAETTATAATFSFKGAFTALKTVIATNPLGVIFTAVTAITMAFSWFKQKQEEASQALQDAITEYDSAKSSLESINSELEDQNKKMDELLAKDKLTYAEKGQLEELQAITQELLLQQDIEEKRADKASKDVADKTVDAYKKQYGKYDKSEDYLKELLTYENMPILDDAYNVFGIVAAYIRAQKLLEQSQKEFDDAVKNGNDTTWIAEDVQHNIDAVEDYRQALDDNISDLQEKRLALEDEYNKAVEKRQAGIEPLTSLDKDVIETYESIYDVMKTVYEYTDKNSWNNMEISNIFNTEGIEKTKEELISMYKSGELASADMLEQFPKLNQAIKESEIIAGEGSDAFKEFFNEIAALADETEDVVNGVSNNTSTLSITETIAQLNTQLKPTFDSLKSAYEDIFTTDDNGNPLFTLENVDLSMLDSIKSAIDELNENDELGISIDYSSFENLARTLADTASTESDVRNGFNEFITDVVYGTAALENLNASDAKLIETMLESLGVTNAHEIVYDSLIAKTEALALEEQLLSSVGGDLANATADKVLAFLNQAGASEVARNYLIKLIAEEQVFSNQELDVSGKISKLQELAQAYGQTALAAKIASQEKANEESHTVGSWSEADLQQFQKEWNDGLSSVSIDFSPKSSSKSKKSGSGKSEKDLWLEEYKKKLAELQNLLAKGVINEREFFSQSEILLNTYLKDSEEHMTKYAEEISDAEKTLHSDRMNAYQYEADELLRLQNGNYLNMTEYYQSMIGLQDEYYNSEALKLKNLADTMEAQYGRMSHVTLTRPSVDASEIQSAGYTTELTSSSVYAQSFGDETKQVVLTPILPDGTVLSPEALTAYADKLLKGEKIDADIQLSMFEGKDAVKQTAEYINGLEKMQSEYQTLKKTFSESPYGDFTEEQLEAIEKLTEEIEKHKSQLTSELGDIKSAYDDLIEIRDTYNEYGKISVDQYQSLCDMGFEYLALLSNESGALSLDGDAFQRLTDAKIQQIQVDMALQATDLIKNIQTEEQAVQYLAASYENLAANALSAAEQMLYAAQANAQLMYGADSMQAQAANTIVKGYENSKLAAGVVDIKMQSGGGYEKPKEDKSS